MKKHYMDDRGVSLVELLVSVAILSVVLTIVIGFVLFSTNQYHKGNREANLSNESQLLVARLENYLMNASYGVGTGSLANLGVDLGESASIPKSGDVLYIYNRKDDLEYNLICLYPDSTDETLKYQKFRYLKQADGSWKWSPGDTDGSWKWDTTDEEDIASYVKSFSVDLGGLATNSTVTVTLEMEFRDRTYKTSNTFVIRNKVTAVRDRKKFEDLVKAG